MGHIDARIIRRICQGILLDFFHGTFVRHERQDETLGTEGTNDIRNETLVRANLLVRFKRCIRRSRFGCDVNRRVGTEEDRIHRVATWFKGTWINQGARAQRVDTRDDRLFTGDTFRFLFLRFAFNVALVLIIIEELGNRFVDIEHHDVEDTVGIDLQPMRAHRLVGHKDEPVVPREGSQGIPIAIQALAQRTVRVKVFQLLVEGLVWEGLVAGEVEVLA